MPGPTEWTGQHFSETKSRPPSRLPAQEGKELTPESHSLWGGNLRDIDCGSTGLTAPLAQVSPALPGLPLLSQKSVAAGDQKQPCLQVWGPEEALGVGSSTFSPLRMPEEGMGAAIPSLVP